MKWLQTRRDLSLPFRSADPDGAIELNIDAIPKLVRHKHLAQFHGTVARSLRDKRSQLLGRMACKPSNKYRIQTQQKKVGFGNPLEPWSKPSPVPSRRRPGCTDACIRVTRELVPVFVSQRHGAVVDGCKRPAHNAVSEYAFVRPGHVHIIALHPCKMQFAAADTCWNRDRRIDVPTPDCIPENELLTRRVDKGEENRGSDNGGQILSR